MVINIQVTIKCDRF